MSWELKMEKDGKVDSIATGTFTDDGKLLYDSYAQGGYRVSLFCTGLTTLEHSTYEAKP